VRIATGLGIGGAGLVHHAMLDRMAHVAAVHVSEPRLDLLACAQHPWRPGLGDLVGDGHDRVRSVHRKLRGGVPLLGRAREAVEIESGSGAHGPLLRGWGDRSGPGAAPPFVVAYLLVGRLGIGATYLLVGR